MTTTADQDRGIVRTRSQHSVAQTVQRLRSMLKERGLVVFACIDFSADAARAGLAMRPEQLLLFGNPKAGTPLMLAAPEVGLDLPLKALVWEDAHGAVWIAHNDAHYVVRRHGLAPLLAADLAAVEPILERAAQA